MKFNDEFKQNKVIKNLHFDFSNNTISDIN